MRSYKKEDNEIDKKSLQYNIIFFLFNLFSKMTFYQYFEIPTTI